MKVEPGGDGKPLHLPVKVVRTMPARAPEVWWVEGADREPIAGPYDYESSARSIAESLATAPHLFILVVTGDHYGAPMWPDHVFDDWDAVPSVVREMFHDGECVLWQMPEGFVGMVLTERLHGDYMRR